MIFRLHIDAYVKLAIGYVKKSSCDTIVLVVAWDNLFSSYSGLDGKVPIRYYILVRIFQLA